MVWNRFEWTEVHEFHSFIHISYSINVIHIFGGFIYVSSFSSFCFDSFQFFLFDFVCVRAFFSTWIHFSSSHSWLHRRAFQLKQINDRKMKREVWFFAWKKRKNIHTFSTHFVAHRRQHLTILIDTHWLHYINISLSFQFDKEIFFPLCSLLSCLLRMIMEFQFRVIRFLSALNIIFRSYVRVDSVVYMIGKIFQYRDTSGTKSDQNDVKTHYFLSEIERTTKRVRAFQM